MKKVILTLCSAFALVCVSAGHAQVQSFEFGTGVTNTLSVPAGKLIRIHSLISTCEAIWTQAYGSYAPNTGNSIIGIFIQLPSGRTLNLSPLLVSLGGTQNYWATTALSSISSVTPHSPLLIPGPIVISGNTEKTTLLVFEIMDNVASSSVAQIPSQGSSVVVPTTAAGDVDVKMEQSADNVTWTECLPGTYNSSTVKRFFRLRAVEK